DLAPGFLREIAEPCGGLLLGAVVPVDDPDPARSVAYAPNEIDEIALAGVGAVAACGLDRGPDGVARAAEVHPAALRTPGLDGTTGRTGRVVADEEDIVPRVFDHGFQVVDDAPAGGHAAGGQDHCRAMVGSEIFHRPLVLLVAVDGVEAVEIK